MLVCQHHRIILTKSSRRGFSQYLPFQSLNYNTRVRCERCSRLIKKILARRKPVVVVHLLGQKNLYTVFECFYGRFQKVSKCPLMLLIILQCRQSHAFIMQSTTPLETATIQTPLHSGNDFGVITSLLIFSTTRPSTQYRKHEKGLYVYLC